MALKLLGPPVVPHDVPLQVHGEVLGERLEASGTPRLAHLACHGRLVVGDDRVCAEGLEAGLEGDFALYWLLLVLIVGPRVATLPLGLPLLVRAHLVGVDGSVNGDAEREHWLLHRAVLDLAGLQVREALLRLDLERRSEEGEASSFVPTIEKLAEMNEVLVDILLVPCAELSVSLAHQELEHLRTYVLTRPLGAGLHLGTVLVGEEACSKLRHLSAEVLGSTADRRCAEDGGGGGEVAFLELREGEEHLKHAVHVTAVPKVLEAYESGAAEGYELLAALADAIEVKLDVEIDLQLSHSLLRLLHLHHVDAPVREVLCKERILNHVVLVLSVRVHIRPVRGDGPKLDAKAEVVALGLFLLVVLQRSPRPPPELPRAVDLTPPGANVAV
mmetsp:Transcript_41999/g.102957  ORF Transcript_41999/g.102957 Transcript_41999/m.102957 type:complete len:388 (-) Transcript_41999:761-1924(-)